MKFGTVSKPPCMAVNRSWHYARQGLRHWRPHTPFVSSWVPFARRQARCTARIGHVERLVCIHDVVLGVPCVLDSSGLREIIELSITDEEQALLEAAAESVRSRLGQAANTNI